MIRGHRGELFEMLICCEMWDLFVYKSWIASSFEGFECCVEWWPSKDCAIGRLRDCGSLVWGLGGSKAPPNSSYIHILRKCHSLIKKREWVVVIEHYYH